MTFEFRSASRSDAGAISKLAIDTCEKFIFPDSSPDGRSNLENLYSQENLKSLMQAGHRFLISRLGDELVGAVAMNSEDRRIFLMFVAELFQRQGLGKMLITQLLASEIEQKIVTLNSSLFAREFYRDLGFTVCGPVKRNQGIDYQPMKLSRGVL